jgi:hypothetical protein
MALASIADLNGPIAEVTKRIEQAKKLSLYYDDYVALDQDGADRAPGIHASEIYPCLRKPVYSLTGVPRKPAVPKFWKQRFKVGKAIHLMLQEDFHKMSKRSAKNEAMRVAAAMAAEMDCYIEFQDEVPVGPEHQEIAKFWNIHSSADGVFTFRLKTTGEIVLRVGLEIKSEAMDGYDKLKEPKPEHVRQAHVYMATLDLPLMWFLYMNKNNQNNTPSSAPWLVTWQPKIWEELEVRFRVVHDFARGGTIPERTEGIWCEFCPWRYHCQPNNMVKASQRPAPVRRELR